MFSLLRRGTDPERHIPIAREQFDHVLRISQALLASLYQFDRQAVWTSVVSELRKLYDCELVCLFLVDDDDPSFMVLKTEFPAPKSLKQVRLKVTSELGQGITGHAANIGETILLDYESIKDNPHIKNKVPHHLPSKSCYSALITPLFNRKHRLVGALTLYNKSISEHAKQARFTSADQSTIELLAVEIVALLENVNAFDSLRAVIEDIQKACSTDKAIQCILSCAVRLLQGNHAKLGLWSQAKGGLVLAGTKNLRGELLAVLGGEIPRDNIMAVLWKSAIERALSGAEGSADADVWLNTGPHQDGSLRRCDPEAKSSISVLLRVHQQPIGVLQIESFAPGSYDDLDRQILKALAQNVSTAVESIRMHWPLFEIESTTKEKQGLSLGESGGLFRSIVDHTPMVMWRKDLHGKFLWVNDRFCLHVKMERSDILGKTDFELFPNEFACRHREGDEKAQTNGTFEDPEEPFMLPNGDTSVIHVLKVRIRDHLGNVVGTQGVFLDVTGDKYRELFREAPIGFFELDADGKIFHANKTGRTMLDYGENEIVPNQFSQLANDAAIADEIVMKHIRGEEPEGEWGRPINLRKKDGSIIPVAIASRRVTDSLNNPVSLLCAVRVLSAGAEIEEALREPDSRYLARIRELDIPVFCIDRDLKTTFVNEALLQESGLQRDETIGKTSNEIYRDKNEDLARRYDADNQEVIATGIVLDKIEFHVLGDGNKAIVRVLKFPIRDSKDEVIGVQGVFWRYQDEDRAKTLLRDALYAAKEEYRQIVQGAVEGIFQSSKDGKFIAANPTMVHLLGYETEEELLKEEEAGKDRFALDAQREEYFKKVGLAELKKAVTIDYELKRPDGETIWVSETVQKLRSPQNRLCLVGFAVNITERHHAARAKEDMLRMLAHQLRSPAWQCYKRSEELVRLMDPQELLGTHSSDEVRAAATIRGLARKTRGVAWSIGMMSTLAHTDQVVLSPTTVTYIAPRRLIKIAIVEARDAQLLRRLAASFRERMGRSGAVPNIDVKVEDQLESSLRIHGDLGLIEQSIGCLIENAFKYSKPSSTIRIHCVLGRDFVTLSIESKPTNGLEVDKEVRENCRKREWRAKAAEACDADGTGLGLWLVDRILQAHQGKLLVDETNEFGWNKFSLQFPLKTPSDSKR